METLLALALAVQDPDLAVQGRVRRRGGEYELALAGRGKSLEEGMTVSLRFHPAGRRLAWEDRSIEDALPEEASAGRSVPVKRGGFVHVERFGAPGTVEVRILLEKEGAAPLPPIVRTFRLATGREAAEALERDFRELRRAGEGLLALVEEGEGILDAPCGAGRRGREYRLKLERRFGAWREAMAASSLRASADAFARLIGDVESAAHSPCVRPISALSGRPFHLETTPEYVEGILEAAEREAAIVLAGEIEEIRAEAAALVSRGDARAWARAEAEMRRNLEGLREGAASRRPYQERLESLVGGAEELVGLSASAVVCPGSVAMQVEERQDSLATAIREFQEEMRILR